MNSLQVRPEHVNALRAVDLRLAFGNHGYIDYIPKVGSAVLAVTDEEYEIAHDFVQDLHVERGDVFTQEGVAHNGSSPGQSLFSALEWHIGAHKYIESDVFAALQQFDKQYKDQSESFPESSFSTIWNNLRSLQVIDPVHYALGLAVAKRIPSYYADMSAEDYQKWDESVEKATKRIPKPVLAAACFFMRPIFEHLDFNRRNQATLDALGNIALKMSSDNSEKPVLAYMGGQAHARPILSALCSAAVDYSATSFYPHGNSRKLRIYGRQIGSLLHMCESNTTNFQKQWLDTISQNQKL